MADLVVTKTQVIPGADAELFRGPAGVAITPGQPIYKNASDGRYYLADADAEDTAEAEGVAVSEAAAAGQQVVGQKGGELTLGAGAAPAQGAVLIVSVNPGGIAPVADLASGDYLTVLGVGKGSNKIDVRVWRTGVAKA